MGLLTGRTHESQCHCVKVSATTTSRAVIILVIILATVGNGAGVIHTNRGKEVNEGYQ